MEIPSERAPNRMVKRSDSDSDQRVEPRTSAEPLNPRSSAPAATVSPENCTKGQRLSPGRGSTCNIHSYARSVRRSSARLESVSFHGGGGLQMSHDDQAQKQFGPRVENWDTAISCHCADHVPVRKKSKVK